MRLRSHHAALLRSGVRSGVAKTKSERRYAAAHILRRSMSVKPARRGIRWGAGKKAGMGLIGGCGALAAFIATSPDDDDLDDAVRDADLPLVYDADAISAYYSSRPRVVLKRMGQIFGLFLPYFGRLVGDYVLDRTLAEVGASRAIELRNVLTFLGPAFIKLGQMLSSRPDLLPTVYITELRKLCDQVPPFPTLTAMAVIEEELGKDVLEDIGIDEGTQPIAAASLGQVYRCTRKSTGR